MFPFVYLGSLVDVDMISTLFFDNDILRDLSLRTVEEEATLFLGMLEMLQEAQGFGGSRLKMPAGL